MQTKKNFIIQNNDTKKSDLNIEQPPQQCRRINFLVSRKTGSNSLILHSANLQTAGTERESGRSILTRCGLLEQVISTYSKKNVSRNKTVTSKSENKTRVLSVRCLGRQCLFLVVSAYGNGKKATVGHTWEQTAAENRFSTRWFSCTAVEIKIGKESAVLFWRIFHCCYISSSSASLAGSGQIWMIRGRSDKIVRERRKMPENICI